MNYPNLQRLHIGVGREEESGDFNRRLPMPLFKVTPAHGIGPISVVVSFATHFFLLLGVQVNVRHGGSKSCKFMTPVQPDRKTCLWCATQ